MKNLLFIMVGAVLVCGCAQYRSTYSHTENITQTIEKRPDGLLYFDPEKVTYLAMADVEDPLVMSESVTITTRTNGQSETNIITTISTSTNPPVVVPVKP